MPAKAQCASTLGELVLVRVALVLRLGLVLAISNLLLVPGKLAFKLVQTEVYAGQNVRARTSPYKTLTVIGLDDDLYGIIQPLLGNDYVHSLYFVEKVG